MSTKRRINSENQVKLINGQRWICQRVVITETTKIGDYDFIHESDGYAWKKIRPWKFSETRDKTLAGQHFDDKGYEMYYINNGYAEDGYFLEENL
jgi:hypothetical protein